MDNTLLSDKEESDTKILLEKEFDDFYEDRVHKSAGPVIFVSKTLGMLPVIWTEDETENECKSYFNLYTFVIFIGTYLRTPKIDFKIYVASFFRLGWSCNSLCFTGREGVDLAR